MVISEKQAKKMNFAIDKIIDERKETEEALVILEKKCENFKKKAKIKENILKNRIKQLENSNLATETTLKEAVEIMNSLNARVSVLTSSDEKKSDCEVNALLRKLDVRI